MAIESISVPQAGPEGSRFERITLGLVALCALATVAGFAGGLRAGLYAPAFLLGWTQLVGL
ncbi:MAG TPA: hypothetical protein VLQ45_03135 [Thermoanaerobaculia bacterium]|nr:hypothetical protein [Thermoanaerobaculia bacterium]